MVIKHRIVLIGVVALLLSCALVGTVSVDIYVPDNYEKIQGAVDNASADDTIIVTNGTSAENVDVYKSLTNHSENGAASTIVQAANPASENFTDNTLTNKSSEPLSNINTNVTASDNKMIYLRTINFNSSLGEPSLPSNLRISVYSADVKGYYIAQFIGPVKPEWKEHLRQLGCEIYDYIPANAFIIRMGTETEEIVQDLDFVQWIGIYQPAYKINPELSIKNEEAKINLIVLAFRRENREEISLRLKELGGENLKSSGDVISVRIPASKIGDIAKINDVEWIEEYIQPEILNDVSRWVIQSNVNSSTPIWEHNITGAGQIVGISDSGLDYDSCFFWDSVNGAPPEDSGLPSTVTPDYNQRKVIVYHDVAEFGDYDDDYPGHGTHTSGSIVGDNLATSGGYDTNDGMAYTAKLVFQDLGQDGSPSIYPPPDLNDLFQQAYDDGARIHSNSWGSSAFGAYTTDSKQCDEFMWNHKDFLILFANGNNGPDSNTVGSPATAKNVVSVGATENGARAENMAFFSSHGPTDDGRIKPTICAPGVNIWSADSDGNIASYNCGVVSMSGTSMSTPTTAGAAALIRQYFVDGYYPTGNATPSNSITPSAALIKAILVNSGEEMSGSYTGGPIPSYGQGWGRILLDNTLYFEGDSRRLEIYDFGSVNTGQQKTYNIAVDNQSEPLEVTLVWTDYPSTPAAAINLVNDLNLVVTGPDGIYAASDKRNVEESVYIKTPPVGAYTISVTGYNVPEGPQPFALVISGGLGIGSKGVVYLDKEWYNCSGIVNVTVKDADLNADNTTVEEADVSIMSFPTEKTPENIVLTETGVDTATFTGSIGLTTSPPFADGNLSIAHGDLITVFYVDADDGTGNPITVHDTATVDCIAPVITVTTPQNNTTYNTNSVALNYSVNEKTDWEGYSLDGQPIVIISGNTTLGNLTEGWHNVTVFASDIAGNINASDKIWFNITTPDIWVYPESFEVILPQGNISNRTLTIGNNGSGILEFEISDKRRAAGLSVHEHPNLSLSANSTSAPDDYVVSTVESKLNGENVLIIKDVDTWGYPANEEVLTKLGIAYDVATSADIASIDLSSYKVVIIASDQWQSFYDRMAGQIPKLEEYVSNGGILEVHACDWGWNGGQWSELLPGGVRHIHDFDNYNYIVAPEHPIVEGLTNADFVGWNAVSHGSFTDLLPETVVILENSYGNPTFIEYEFGYGVVVASMETLEWAYMHGYCQNGKILYNTIMYTYTLTPGADWLTEYPQNGTISPSNQTNITVTFNATDLDIGKYNATIVINSNDPDESKVGVPVRLIVTQLYPPDIWVEPESFDVTAFRGEVRYENLTIDNNGTGDLAFNITDTVTGQFLFDDMESGVDGWTHGGSYDEWELGTPTYGPPSAHSGSNCWGTDLDNTYENFSNQWLMSPRIDLSTAQNVNLSFYIWYMTESCCDPGLVEISIDNGITWTILRTYRGAGANWSHETVDISGYAENSSVRIRFRLTSDISVVEAGLYIDDVIVSGEDAMDWLSITPSGGTVLPKNQTNLTVEINTNSLQVGKYNATIIITHNDILHDTLNIPLNLSVFSDYHDIAVTNITAPDSAEINSTIVVNSTISNFGLNDESNITIDFIVDGINQSNATIPYLASFASTNVNFNWTAPGVEGEHNLTIYTEPVINETIRWNNMLSRNISVRTFADIWVEPDSYNFTIKRGDVECENLTIGNNGTGILIFNITTQARASPAPTISPIPITYEDTQIIIEQEFGKPDIKKTKIDKEEYDRVTIPSLPKIVKAGEPVLPVKSLQILLPFGKDVQSIEVVGEKRDLVGTYYVEPGEEPVPIGIPMKEPPKIAPNATIYSSTEPYLGLYEASVQNLRGYKIINLNLYPVQYTPNPGTIAHYTEMKVTVNTKLGVNSLYRGLPEDNERVLQVVDNPEIADTYPINTKFAPSYDHVIITNSTFESAFQQLADWKTRKGVRSHVVTVEYIYANYPGRDNSEKIRNYINDSYMNDGIEYVLLGGDGDGSPVGGETGSAVVPARGFYADGEYNIPADLYYAALDGTWNDNNDTRWGEPGEDDLYAEVFVGRAAVDSLAEVENFINKTIAYESIADDPYLKKAWMVGEDLGWAVWGSEYKEEIRNGSSNWGYNTSGFPEEYNVSTLYDRPGYSWPKSVLINIMNYDTPLIFNHLGHANVNYVMKLYNSDVDALVNDKYFFAYSQGCYDGSFDNRGTDGGYYTYDCIAEHFTITPHSAFAFIGNSRYGWDDYYTTNGPSQHYDRQFYDAVFNESIGNLGKANQDSKEDSVWQINGSFMRWCYYELNLFGDPETSLVPTAVPWLSVSPNNGTVGVGNDTNVSVCVVTTYLEEGTYDASIIIKNNDPDENPVMIPVNLTVTPPDHDIAVTNLSADDEVEVNKNISVNATVCNRGSNDETDIVVDFIVDGVTEDNITIPSLTSGNCMNVSFVWTAPSLAGIYNMTIYAEPVVNETIVWNNMMSQNISVVTIADIWLDPEAINVTLPRGDITNRTLTIGNNGTGVLEFEIRGAGLGTGSILVDDGHGNTPYVAFYNDLVYRGFTVDHTMNEITPSLLTGYDAFITVQASYSYSADEIEAIQNFVNFGGGLFVIGDDNPYIYEQLTGYAGISWSSYGGSSGVTTNIYPHAMTEGINELYFGAPIASLIVSSPAQDIVLDGIGSTIQVAASEYGSGKIVALVDEQCLDDYSINMSDNRLFGRNVINWICAGALWLNVTPPNGTISPSNQTNVTVTINATDLDVGKYNATIVISNNDPDESPMNVPVNLTVISSEHDIAVTNLTVPEEVEVNTTISINGTICNLGLNDENVVIDLIVNGVTEDDTTISLTSGNCTNVSFIWTAPSLAGIYNMTIYAESVINETLVWNNLMSQNISVITILAEFNEVYADHGEDTNGDGLNNSLVVEIGVNVRKVGLYQIGGSLYQNATSTYVTWAYNTSYLNAGIQTVQLGFDGVTLRQTKYNGTFDLRYLSLYNTSDWITLDYRYYAYTTGYYEWPRWQKPSAEFNDVYADYGEDSDGDGLNNSLVIKVGVNVTKAGIYQIGGSLYQNATSLYVAGAYNTSYLSEGIQTVQLRFDGIALRRGMYNGTYDLSFLSLVNTTDWTQQDYRYYAYTTGYYKWPGWQNSSAEFNGVYADYGEDTDGDGLNNSLVVEIGVNVTRAGRYQIGVSLYQNATLTYVTWAYNTSYLSEGNHMGQLRFDGITLRQTRYNGTYDLRYLGLYNTSDWTQQDYRYYAYTTSYYNYTEFEESIPDAYEPDDNPSLANYISADGTKQTHNFHVPGDQDWLKFNATVGTSYTLETSELGPSSDTYLYLYDTDGTTEIVHDDDSGIGLASKIIWNCSISGTYYAMIRHYSYSAFGPDTRYNISITAKLLENTLIIPDLTVLQGANTTTSIMLKNSTGVASIGIKLSYNASVVNVTDATVGDFTDYFAFDNTNVAGGRITINTYILGQDLTGDVKVADVTLAAVGDPGDSSPLNLEILSMADQYGNDVTGTTDNGTFTISVDMSPPIVTNPTSSHEIPDDTDNDPRWGETATLNVMVTDDTSVAFVTINLTAIGGSPTRPMSSTTDNIWSFSTNASAGTPPQTYYLQVNASDIYGRSNTSVSIPLVVMRNGDTTGNKVVNIADAMLLANNVSYPYHVPSYTISSLFVADVSGNGVVNIADAMLIANNVSYPYHVPPYVLR